MGVSTFLGSDRPPAQLRGVLWLSLTEVGRVQSRSRTSDSGGGVTETWEDGPDVPCRIDPVRAGNEMLSAARISDRSTHLITAPPGTGGSTADRFEVDGRGVFEVTAVRSRTGQAAQIFEAVQVS